MQLHKTALNQPFHINIGAPELSTLNIICSFVGTYHMRIQSVLHWDYTEKENENVFVKL